MTQDLFAAMTATPTPDSDADGNAEFLVAGSGFIPKDGDIILNVLGTTSHRVTCQSDGTFTDAYEVPGAVGPWTFRAYQYDKAHGGSWQKRAEFTTP